MYLKIFFSSIATIIFLSCSKESPIQGINTASTYIEPGASSNSTISPLTYSQGPTWFNIKGNVYLPMNSQQFLGIQPFFALNPNSGQSDGVYSVGVKAINLTGYFIEFSANPGTLELIMYEKGSEISAASNFSTDINSDFYIMAGYYSNLTAYSTNYTNTLYSPQLNTFSNKYIGFRVRDFNGKYVYYGWIKYSLTHNNLIFDSYGYTSTSSIKVGL